eukprot:CAMPEP_0172633594 /NCGR_PEP_ID=MMETSP1068-20121228/190215_1 /TAXON_ID=35684 /ORGANISM="Pseudopedinella elastica, Strain CCMP716" /LENGTH=407 /DNA_ID=CAMNT_0013445329 /DNA_START=55 /DNA_END=1278 /DNA_ORIENTATION=-
MPTDKTVRFTTALLAYYVARASCMSISISRRGLLRATGAVMAASSPHASRIAEPEVGGPRSQTLVGYSSRSIRLSTGTLVPVALWYPADQDTAAALQATAAFASKPYRYRISVSKIFQMLLGIKPPFDIAREIELGSAHPDEVIAVAEGEMRKSQADLPAVVFCHGFLGSRFDFHHVCESLAAQGFVVAAPELPESLSASFTPDEGTSRSAIVEKTVSLLQDDFSVGKALGIMGHSAGGGTATSAPGDFQLGRVAVAGFRSYEGPDPLLVIASEGDSLMSLSRIRSSLPPQTVVFENESGARRYSSSSRPLPRSSALFLANENGIDLLAADGEKSPANSPCHISFLSAATNDAMVKFLSPLLPLARILGVPLLDFDVYALTRDSERTAEYVSPVLGKFFINNAKNLL